MTFQSSISTEASSPVEGASSSRLAAPWGDKTQMVDESAIRQLGSAGDAGTQDLAGTGFTYRHDWGNFRGSWKLNLNWGAINPRSRVFVAIAEGAPGGPDGGKFIGAAKYTLHNVAPRNGGVDIWVDINWGSDIRLYVDYLVINV